MSYLTCDECLDGSKWRINNSGTEFVVVQAGKSYVYVENLNGPPRRRRILRHALRSSNNKSGYTLLVGSPFVEAG